MPLPNTNQPSGDSYNPNTAAMSQMGTSVNMMRKMQDQNQAIAKTLDSLSAKMSNITNIRTNAQSGIFEAFGNNFVSRGMNEIVSGISDSISSLLSPPEEEKEDPMLVAIKKIATDIEVISDNGQKQIEYTKESNALLIDQKGILKEISALAKNPRVNPTLLSAVEKQEKILYKQEGTLKKILDFFTKQSTSERKKVETEQTIEKPVVVSKPRRPSKQTAAMRKRNAPTDIEIKNPLSKTNNLEPLPDAPSATVSESAIVAAKDSTKELVKETSTEVVKESKTDTGALTASTNLLSLMTKDISQSKITLSDILAVQRESNTSLEKLVSGATATSQQQSADRAKDVEQAAAGTEDEFGKKPASFKEELANMLDKTFNLKKISEFFRKPESKKSEKDKDKEASGGEPQAAQQNAESSILGDIATTAAGTALGGTSLAKMGSKLASAGKLAKAAAIPAAIMSAGVAGVDALAGVAGVGKNADINEQQDQANWDKMSMSEKFQSGTARGIEKLGSFLFMGNMSKQAQADRIKKESEYFEKRDAKALSSVVDPKATSSEAPRGVEDAKQISRQDVLAQQGAQASSNLEGINQSQKDLTKETKEPVKDSSPVVNNINNVSNQTILPGRQIVKNTDDSYNRYLSSVLA